MNHDDPASSGSHTEAAESAAELQAPAADRIHEAIRREGEEELRRSTGALGWSGLACGLSMGLSLLVEGLLQAHLPDADWRPLLSNWGYAVGFLVVILGRQQLFTENTLTPVLPLLHRRTFAMLLKVLRLWLIVLVSNLLGVLAFSFVLARTSFFPPEAQEAFSAIGHEALRHSFGPTFVGAVFAGWLIALMVWLIPYAETARAWVVLLMAYLVALGGFAHIIAGSTEVLYLVMEGSVSWSTYLLQFFSPTLLGNITGGVALVALLNHGQVAADEASPE